MMKVLVIDDDPHIGATIRLILDRQGCETVIAASAHAGLHTFELTDFDLVLVDIFMPGMNGLDTILRLRGLAPTVPIVAMSGFGFRDAGGITADFLGMAIERGANTSVRKPFTPWELMAAINSSLGLESSGSEHLQ